MSGVKGRSGRRPKAWENKSKEIRITNQEKADLFLSRVWDNPEIDDLDKAKLALPIYLKTMTDKQSITQLSTTFQLTNEQIDKLLEYSKRNSLIYNEIDKSNDNDT